MEKLLNKNLMEIENNIEENSKTFLDLNENEKFITKDGIKFELNTNHYKKFKLIFEKNYLNLLSISLTKMNSGFIYSKVFEIGNNFYKTISKGKYVERKNENYYRVVYSKNNIKYFNPNGPAEIFYNENGEIDSKTYYLFGKIVNEKKYNEFISKLKSGQIEKNINRYKKWDKIIEILEFAKYYSLNSLVEKCKSIIIIKKLER